MVRIAAFQAPLLPSGSLESLDLIRTQIARCEVEGVQILCCPEAVLGGLADYSHALTDLAMSVETGQLHSALRPLASDTVTSIVRFTEVDHRGRLFNAAAVFHNGAVLGVCRKVHPAIRRSVYDAGRQAQVFRVGDLTFGIAICRDSTYPNLVSKLAVSGATALFVPTNNALPRGRSGADLPTLARRTDISRATENRLYVIRADVAGRNNELSSHRSSGMVDPDGIVVHAASPFCQELLIADLDAP